MIKLNTYINEAWGGMKQHSLKSTIETWCDEMGIQNYTINDKGEIDVDGDVNLNNKNFKELPYKFGSVTGYFSLSGNKSLTSLKNCPNFIGAFFSCSYCISLKSIKGSPHSVGGSFYCFGCKIVDSLEGCPSVIRGGFDCSGCKRKVTIEEVSSLCTVGGRIKL